MTVNATQIINAALGALLVIDPNETPSASLLNGALISLNGLIDSRNTERLNIPSLLIADYSLTTGTPVYTMGTSLAGTAGTLSPVRPVKIERANYVITAGGIASPMTFQLRIINVDEWAEIVTKADSSGVPKVLYPDYQSPVMDLYFFPIPAFSTGATVQVELYVWNILAQFANLTTNYDFPPGYFRALVYSLAMEYAPFVGMEVPDTVVAARAESMAAYRALNETFMSQPDAPTGQVPANAVQPPPQQQQQQGR